MVGPCKYKKRSMHFLVWVMLWWGAGGSRIIGNIKNSKHFLVWVMLWRGAGGAAAERH